MGRGRPLLLRVGTQGPRRVLIKTQWAKRFDQERKKSQWAQEAEGPRMPESRDRAVGATVPETQTHRSPPGLPRVRQAPVHSSHGSTGKQVEEFGSECIAPWQWIKNAAGWQQWGQFCRGGGGGNTELLAGLQALLEKAKPAQEPHRKAKGKGKPDGGGRPQASAATTDGALKKGKGQGSTITSDSELLKALEALVKKAQKEPESLLDGLQELVKKAVVGYGDGRAARRLRARHNKEASSDAGRAQTSSPEFCRPVAAEEQEGSTWTVVDRKQPKGQTQVQRWMIDPLVGGLVGFGVAKKRLSDGEKLGAHLIVACDQAELDSLLTLARAHDVKEKISVICRFSPTGHEAEAMQLPSIGPKGEKQVRTWPAVPFGSAGAPAVVHKVVLRSSFQAPDRKLATLRLQVPRVFQDEVGWANFCKQPNDKARQALGSIPGEANVAKKNLRLTKKLTLSIFPKKN